MIRPRDLQRPLVREDSQASSPFFLQRGGDEDGKPPVPTNRLSSKRTLSLSNSRAKLEPLSPPVPQSWLQVAPEESTSGEEPSRGSAFRQPLRQQSWDARARTRARTRSPPIDLVRSGKPASSSLKEGDRGHSRGRSRSPRRPSRRAAIQDREEQCTVCRMPILPGDARYRGYLPQHDCCGKALRAERDYMKGHPEACSSVKPVKSYAI